MQYLYEMSLWLKHHCKRRSLLTHWVHRFITVHIRTPLTMNWVPWTLRKNQLHRSWQSKKQEPGRLSPLLLLLLVYLSHDLDLNEQRHQVTPCSHISLQKINTVQVYLQKIIHSASIYPLEITEFSSTDLSGYLSLRVKNPRPRSGSRWFYYSGHCLSC